MPIIIIIIDTFLKNRKSQSIFFLSIHETEVINNCVECGKKKRQKRAQDMAVFNNFFMNKPFTK